jgi:amino acid permease
MSQLIMGLHRMCIEYALTIGIFPACLIILLLAHPMSPCSNRLQFQDYLHKSDNRDMFALLDKATSQKCSTSILPVHAVDNIIVVIMYCICVHNHVISNPRCELPRVLFRAGLVDMAYEAVT